MRVFTLQKPSPALHFPGGNHGALSAARLFLWRGEAASDSPRGHLYLLLEINLERDYSSGLRVPYGDLLPFS